MAKRLIKPLCTKNIERYVYIFQFYKCGFHTVLFSVTIFAGLQKKKNKNGRLVQLCHQFSHTLIKHYMYECQKASCMSCMYMFV